MPMISKPTVDVVTAVADVLFSVTAHTRSAADVASVRSTCSLWRDTIDSAAENSMDWRQLACAALGAAPREASDLAPATLAPSALVWHDAWRVLSRHPNSRRVFAASTSTTLGALTVSPEAVAELLDWCKVAAEVAAVDCGVSFGAVLNGEGRSQLSLAVYTACSQKPPHNLQARVYAWWLSTAFECARAIRSRLAAADADVQQAARLSFASFVKQMSSVVLPYLDRVYVRRYEVANDTAASLPSVREVGRRALALLDAPFDVPLPASEDSDPCPEVPRTPEGDVDEPALVLRQRRAWHLRDLERFDEILAAHADGLGDLHHADASLSLGHGVVPVYEN